MAYNPVLAIDVAENLLFLRDQGGNLQAFSGVGLDVTSQASGLLIDRFWLIGIPVALNDPADGTPVELFGDDLGPYGETFWEMARWNETTDVYDVFGGAPEPPLIKPGLGYWLWQDVVGQATIDVQPDQYDHAPSADVVIAGEFPVGSLADKSHVVLANPFNRTFNALDLRFGAAGLSFADAIADEGLNAFVYTWDGWNYAYTAPQDAYIWPWQGFFLSRTGGISSLDITFQFTGPAKSTVAWPDSWRLDLSVVSADGEYRDVANGVGGTTSSTAGYDPYDAFEFTSPNDRFVSLYFTADGQRLTVDNREYTVETTRRYDFTVWTHALPGEALQLTWPNITTQDPELTFTLVDAAGNILADLRATDHYSFTSGDGADSQAHLAVLVSRGAVTAPAAPIAQARITSVHPNPFNPATTVSFTLAAASTVELAAYDLRGRQVAIVARGDFAAGEHDVRWDATDAPAGTYVLRLTAGGRVSTQTVALVK
jgi:hypothetical protein